MSITYTCHNEPKYGSVPKAILAQLPSEGGAPGRGTRCPNCRTATAAGMLSILRRMNGDGRYAAPDSPDRLLEYLFSRAASQRKSASQGYNKESWGEVCGAWALAGVRLASPAQLQALCAALRIRWGSGLERQALQALGGGLMRDAGVDAYLGDSDSATTTTPTMAVTYNASVDLLVDLLARLETFRQLESLRHSVGGVKRLRDATVDVCALLDGTLAACEARRPSTAAGAQLR
ncbi:hypothetical protein F4775DRAFT_596393 [Biscogniauxia sp. FL1348]|nr:hypothetical protein F4775DRAFT_596393 [Biscogniauxia sp. FL1348]